LVGGGQRQVLDQPVPAPSAGLCLPEPGALGRAELLAGFCHTFGGSLLWEEAGENTAPSFNDQVASGIGGNFLGEPLFRIASLLLESGSGSTPGFWRELGAAVISPGTGFNRLVYGKRFAPVFRSYDPAVFTRVDLAGSVFSHYR